MTITAPPTMQKIATELGISVAGLNLRDSRVMMLLMGTTSGNVNLLAAVGKTNSSYSRPNSATYSGTTPTNPTYAYDGTATGIDWTTNTTLTTNTNLTSIQTYSFPAGTKSSVLQVALSNVSTQDNLSPNALNEAISSVLIEYTINNSTYNQLAYYSGDTVTGGTNITLSSGYLTSQNMANLKVRITVSSVRIGSGSGLALAAATCNVADITF